MQGQSWPLSAAATQVLRHPHITGHEVLKLALKELVLRQAWHLTKIRGKKFELTPTGAEPPPLVPLPELHAALLAARTSKGPRDLTKLVKAAIRKDAKMPKRLRDRCRDDLVAQGLLTGTKTRKLVVIPWTDWAVTAAGERGLAAGEARLSWLSTRQHYGDSRFAQTAVASGGLLLLLDPPMLTEIDGQIKRVREADAGAGTTTGSSSSDAPDEIGDFGDFGGGGDFGDLDFGGDDFDIGGIDLSGLDSVDFGGLDSSFDSAVDAGGGGDGGGGDGGGGDGGSS